jgi:hypothetical protein
MNGFPIPEPQQIASAKDYLAYGGLMTPAEISFWNDANQTERRAMIERLRAGQDAGDELAIEAMEKEQKKRQVARLERELSSPVPHCAGCGRDDLVLDNDFCRYCTELRSLTEANRTAIYAYDNARHAARIGSASDIAMLVLGVICLTFVIASFFVSWLQ